eukprot:2327287-Rhodomonas_salina.1
MQTPLSAYAKPLAARAGAKCDPWTRVWCYASAVLRPAYGATHLPYFDPRMVLCGSWAMSGTSYGWCAAGWGAGRGGGGGGGGGGRRR